MKARIVEYALKAQQDAAWIYRTVATASSPNIALATYHLRLYVTNSALRNPTGATLSLPTAHTLLIEAATHDITIVEDDIFADLEQDLSADSLRSMASTA